MDTKQALRREMLTRRKAMTPAQLNAASIAICGYLGDFIEEHLGDKLTIAAYEPFGTEPGGDLLLPLLSAFGPVLLPVLRPDNDLEWNDKGLEGIGEAQLIVVPAVAVDVSGYRLGRGGGSYDRALARASASALRVALLHEGELVDCVPTEPHDERVHFAITPAGVTELDR